MRGLSSRLIENILSFQPKEVNFDVFYPESIVCKIETNTGSVGFGVAICSTSEFYWDEKRAKNLAAGRALKALKNQDNSEIIREHYLEFSKSWTLGQVERVIAHADLLYKSRYFPPETQCFNF